MQSSMSGKMWEPASSIPHPISAENSALLTRSNSANCTSSSRPELVQEFSLGARQKLVELLASSTNQFFETIAAEVCLFPRPSFNIPLLRSLGFAVWSRENKSSGTFRKQSLCSGLDSSLSFPRRKAGEAKGKTNSDNSYFLETPSGSGAEFSGRKSP
jgi:hypothetical protein